VGKKTRAAIYVGLGWAMVPLAPALLGLAGWRGVGLLVLGGLLYTVGAVIYAVRRPDPFPGTFGFHEVFHLLVIAAAACHFAAVAGVAV
jgi:hemolysin III